MAAPMILERVAKQSAGGTGTMPIVHPKGVHDVYVYLPPGVFDVIVSWPGRARVEVIHMPDQSFSNVRTVIDLPAQQEVKERRGLARIASETNQQFFFRSSAPLDANTRLSAQVIPATLELP